MGDVDETSAIESSDFIKSLSKTFVFFLHLSGTWGDFITDPWPFRVRGYPKWEGEAPAEPLQRRISSDFRSSAGASPSQIQTAGSPLRQNTQRALGCAVRIGQRSLNS